MVGAGPGVRHPGARLPHVGPDVPAEQPAGQRLDLGPSHAVRRRAVLSPDGHRHPPGLRERRDAVRDRVLGGTNPHLGPVRVALPGEADQLAGPERLSHRPVDLRRRPASGRLSGDGLVPRRADRPGHGRVLRPAARADPLRPQPPHGAVRPVRPHRGGRVDRRSQPPWPARPPRSGPASWCRRGVLRRHLPAVVDVLRPCQRCHHPGVGRSPRARGHLTASRLRAPRHRRRDRQHRRRVREHGRSAARDDDLHPPQPPVRRRHPHARGDDLSALGDVEDGSGGPRGRGRGPPGLPLRLAVAPRDRRDRPVGGGAAGAGRHGEAVAEVRDWGGTQLASTEG